MLSECCIPPNKTQPIFLAARKKGQFYGGIICSGSTSYPSGMAPKPEVLGRPVRGMGLRTFLPTFCVQKVGPAEGENPTVKRLKSIG